MSEKILLPRNYKPSHYTLSLRDLDFQAWTYKGTVRQVSIDLEITQATKTIILNAEELKITSASLHDENGDASRVIPSSGTSCEEKGDRATVSFDEDLVVAKSYRLVLEYDGIMNDQSMGFYRSQYKALSEPAASVARAKDGSPYMVSTQFQPVGARRAFPCFDEPNMKATFSFDVEIPADQTVISNTPVEATEDVANGLKRVSFEKTPVMSTYLLAWAIGDLKYVEGFTEQEYGGEKIPVRFYATAGLEEQGHFTVEETVKAIDFFSKTFGIDYPLAKMDVIAVPEFTFGAMENWGLITGKTNLLAFDEKTSSASKKETICSIMCHEVAHQWFGNLVTMDWWDELWLNEGFASWAGDYAVDNLHPDWNTWQTFMTSGMEGGMVRDAMRSSHPIHGDVPDARNVHEMLDLISYQKSCSVIDMFSNHMGKQTFLTGVSNYLKENMYQNATAEALWRCLGEASGDDIVSHIKPWIQKVGHPVVTVTEEANGQVTLRQSRFLAVDDMQPEEDETVWWIPLSFRIISDKETPPVISVLSEKQQTVTIPADSLYLLNSSGTGFFRIEYTQEHLAKLGQRREELSSFEKLRILSSSSALTFSGSGSAVSMLGFLQAFADETDPQVWTSMLSDLTRLRRRFDDDAELLPAIKALIRSVIKKMVDEVGWEKVEGESHLQADLRFSLMDEGLNCDSAEIKQAALQNNILYNSDPDKFNLDPSMLHILFGAAAQESPKTVGPEFIDKWQSATSAEMKIRFLRAVGSIRDEDVLRDHVLPFCYGTTPPERVLKPTEMRFLATCLASGSPSRQLQWDYVKANWDAIVAKMGTAESLSTLVNSNLVAMHDAAAVEDIDAFFADRDTNGFATIIAKCKDTILNVDRFRKRERAPLAAWLKEQGYFTS
ncbi:hypothetical protein NLG97_g9497 [Lecanicillium saksenae]|uniref:Uncharacterized protein n=1 Tax=Lecanicillium saksenae TaxID=468837 RepID=A0ACC1QHC1_9HYPO|nr:hypothetical protein NLG97_g9497 [Lecanicillium saksenae]